MASLKWLGEHVDTIHIAEGETCCANCKRYHMHYVRIKTAMGFSFMPTAVGHCSYPRLKDRTAGDCCKYFVEKEDTQQAP